jgi:hypothetical protein
MSFENQDYAPIILAAFESDRKAREETYGPEIGLLGGLSKMDEWREAGYEVENFWYDERTLGWRPKGHPEAGYVVYVL